MAVMSTASPSHPSQLMTDDSIHVESTERLLRKKVARQPPVPSKADYPDLFFVGSMSDPRNVAHAQEGHPGEEHQGEARPEDTPAVQPGRKPAAAAR